MSDSDRPGFAEFRIRSERAGPVLDATHFTYGVAVNDVPLFFDGRPPFGERHALGPDSTPQLAFAVENLGFSGGLNGDGYEKIDVELRYFSGDRPIETARFSLPEYVAYRKIDERPMNDSVTRKGYIWSSVYRPAHEANFVIHIMDGEEISWMNERRVEFDARDLKLFGHTAVGVLRPGRKENARVGVIIGVRLPNRQIKSMFTRAEVGAICRWLLLQSDLLRRSRVDSTIFKFPSETFSEDWDRGQRDGACRDYH